MTSSHWQPSNSSSGRFSKDESSDFFRRLRLHFVSFLVYPRVFTKNPNFNIGIGQVPPVMDPIVSGDVVFDTECEVIQLSICIFSLCPEKFTHSEKQEFAVWVTAKLDEMPQIWRTEDDSAK